MTDIIYKDLRDAIAAGEALCTDPLDCYGLVIVPGGWRVTKPKRGEMTLGETYARIAVPRNAP